MENLVDVAKYITEKRIKVASEGSEMKVFCRQGEKCQEEMCLIYSSLSEGATCFRGMYQCKKCGQSVEVVLMATPDVPYEVYWNSREIEAKNKVEEGW